MKSRRTLDIVGAGNLGLNGLFASLLGVLSLAELGFSRAVESSMYKPIAEDDEDLVCAYLAFYRTVYRRIGAAVFLGGLALLPFVGRLVHGDVPPGIDLRLVYFIHLASAALGYLVFAYRGPVLSAHHRSDVALHVRTALALVQYAVVFAILYFTRSYYLYVLATVAFTAATNLCIMLAARRLFPRIAPRGRLPEALRRKVVADVKAVCLHRFGGIVSASTDNLVLSSALGLVAVAAYGNYFYVVTSVVAFVYAIHSSMTAGFGNKIHVEGRAATLGSFLRANRLVLAAVAWCAAMMLALYQPFVRVWTRDDPALVRHAATPLLMTLYFYADQSRQLLLSLKGAAALWRGDRWKPLVSGLANLSLSVALALLLPEPWKLDGVIGATLLCVVAIEIPWEARAVFGPFFGKGAAPGYWRQQAHFALLAVGLSALAWGCARLVPLSGFAGLLAKAAAAGALSGAAVLALFRSDLAAARGAGRTQR